MTHSITGAALETWLSRCCLRLRCGQFLATLGDWFTFYLLALGAVVLAVKMFGQSLWPHALWLILGLIPVAVCAWLKSGRDTFSRSEAIAILDRRLNAGGLLMSLAEAPHDEWLAHLPRYENEWRRQLPLIRPVRLAQQIAIPLAFLVIACWLPPREIEASSPLKISAGQHAATALEEILEEVQQAELLKEEEQQELAREVAQLAKDTKKSPLTHEKWETVDALRARLQARVDESTNKLSEARRSLGALSAAISGQQGERLSAEERAELEEEAVETLQKLSKQQGGLKGASPKLKDQLQRLTKNGLPEDRAERDELLNDLREHLDSEFDKLSELRAKCKQSGQCAGNGELQESGDSEAQLVGTGGISRGPGSGEMTWGPEAAADGMKFKETILPPGQADKLRDQPVGVSAVAPNADPASDAPRAAARTESSTTGDETWRRSVRPRHRPVLKKYFSDDKPQF